MTMIIRDITAQDEARWRELWQAYLEFYEQNLSAETTQNVWQRLMDETAPLRCFVAQSETGQVIGFTHYFLHGSTWHQVGYVYLEDLYVDQTVRSKGAGRALINAVKTYAKDQGAAKVYWHTNAANETAQALYDKISVRSDFIKFDLAAD